MDKDIIDFLTPCKVPDTDYKQISESFKEKIDSIKLLNVWMWRIGYWEY